ncbi:MAG: enoyl-CoA hydratase/isomerase family protein [Candidatus Hydrogenedentes bacterium]|nr:enoyl-CoA hydratase/isomerase family protein [Candidatus Hydrogenedentota bacterium]
MTEPLVLVRRDPRGVVHLTLNRPEKRNALNIPLLEALSYALDSANDAPVTRAIVLEGAGPAFCAGLDLVEAANPDTAEESANLIAHTLRSIHDSPKVTLAAAHGAAIAGGAGLMAACDLVVAAADLRTGFPEVRRGLVAALVMTVLLRRTAEGVARELLLLGEIVDAGRALEFGLVNRVVPVAQLAAEIEKVIDAVLQGAPGAIVSTKKLMRELRGQKFGEDLERALSFHSNARFSEEAREGMRAFQEKRKPKWATEGDGMAD